MAKFEPAHTLTAGNEGGYANNPADSGGETYKGIARKFHPRWPGWRHVDSVKAGLLAQPPYGSREYSNWVAHLNIKLAQIKPLQTAVLSFYRTGFWGRLSEINSQAVANWVYDHVVNGGARGTMWIQLAAGVKPDGELGSISIAAINAADPDALLGRAEDIAGAYRLDRANAKPSQIQFLRSWLTRDGQPPEIIAMVTKAAADGKLDDSEVATLKAAMVATA